MSFAVEAQLLLPVQVHVEIWPHTTSRTAATTMNERAGGKTCDPVAPSHGPTINARFLPYTQ